MQELNPILDTDSYKPSHFYQFQKGATSLFSYFESRGGKRSTTLFFGLQYILKTHFSKPITHADVDYADWLFAAHGEPFSAQAWHHIVDAHGGYMPVLIRAVPEGTEVTVSNVLMTVESTCAECFWVTSYIETALVRLWYPITVATESFYAKKMIYHYLAKSADNPDAEIDFKLHDFGSRGVSSSESAMIGGMAHLVSFKGTDTVAALVGARNYYNCDMAGFSIPACYDSETDILTSHGWEKFSLLSGQDFVAQYNPDGTISFVKPASIIQQPYTGEMIRFSSDSSTAKIDLVVTPNHRIVRRSVATKKIEIQEADSATFSQKNLWIQGGESVVKGPSLTDNERLKIAFQADGSFMNRKEHYTGEISGSFPIRFVFSKSRKIERLKILAEKNGLSFNQSVHASGKTYFLVRAREQFSKVFDWIDLSTVSLQWCRDFVDEIGVWDGTVKGNNVIYASTVKLNADVVQAVSVLAGYRASVLTVIDKRDNRKPLYQVNICKSINTRTGQGIRIDRVDYSGTVYCVTVPSGMIVVRRNGVVSISGNSEHATITSWGRDGELEAYRNILKQFAKPGSLVAVVSDSYDIYNAVQNHWGNTLRQEVIDSGATIVIRPDSGNPPDVVERILHILDTSYGSVVNSKGYKVLNNVRVIQGDGNDYDMIQRILNRVLRAGFSASNVAFGMGGALLQKVDRDQQKFAYKASSITIDGKEVGISKDPIGDETKKSKSGRLDLCRQDDGILVTRRIVDGICNQDSVLQSVYFDGEVLVNDTLDNIRKRAWRVLTT